jgi:hypothetical protein
MIGQASTLANQLWPIGQSWKRRKWLFIKLLCSLAPTLAKFRRHINPLKIVQRVEFRVTGCQRALKTGHFGALENQPF